jgi:hypothetical protein
MPTYPVTIDGKTYEVDAATPEQATKKGYAMSLAEGRLGFGQQAADIAWKNLKATPGRMVEAARRDLQALTNVGEAVYGLTQPWQEYTRAKVSGETPRFEGAAAAARTVPGFIPNPLLSAAASAGGGNCSRKASSGR